MAERDRETGRSRTGQADRIGKTGQSELARQKQVCQDWTAEKKVVRTRLPGKDCQDRSARRRGQQKKDS
jgi:hypothetical protein